MLAVEVEFLTGRYVATAHDDRGGHEWPPHPARFFSALTATWADVDDPDPAERDVLVQLERLGDPSIVASRAAVRTAVTHFVPINDSAVIRKHLDRSDRIVELGSMIDDTTDAKSLTKFRKELAKLIEVETIVAPDPKANPAGASALFPEQRPKQARQFPSVTPENPTVAFVWPQAELSDEARRALDGILERVVRVGHSASLVACRLTTTPGAVTFSPDAAGPDFVRSVGPGQLGALERAFDSHQGSGARSLPARGVRYASTQAGEPIPEIASVPWTAGAWQVLTFSPRSRTRPITAIVGLARVLRGAVLAHADEPHAELLSGHQPGGGRSEVPHVSFVPLPFVGRAHASGALLGAAVMVPAGLPTDDPQRRAVFAALARWEAAAALSPNADELAFDLELRLGRGGTIRARFDDDPSPHNLRRETWALPSRQWQSVTPIALPVHPGRVRNGDSRIRDAAWSRAEMGVVRACTQVGLPEPASVRLGFDPLVAGSRPTRGFPVFQQTDHRTGRPIARILVHAELTFGSPVVGPLVLGSGRYFGLGLMRPAGRRADGSQS